MDHLGQRPLCVRKSQNIFYTARRGHLEGHITVQNIVLEISLRFLNQNGGLRRIESKTHKSCRILAAKAFDFYLNKVYVHFGVNVRLEI